mmetsp:Transcript_12888/g.26118  ORF Transcript_12888/g.26118 Transcript_12888/m.26118 type:complete len:228 (+) Transcript_12888:324-1007(+)
MHGLPSTAAMLPLHRSPCSTDGRTSIPSKRSARPLVASSVSSHCRSSEASPASRIWCAMRCSRKNSTHASVPLVAVHWLGWGVPPIVLSTSKPNLPSRASAASGVAKWSCAMRRPNSSGSERPDMAMYSMMRKEPPLEPSSYVKTSGTAIESAAPSALSPSASPRNMLSRLRDPDALTTRSHLQPSAAYRVSDAQPLPPPIGFFEVTAPRLLAIQASASSTMPIRTT